jgi:bilin biosynthesis protein
MTLDALFAQLKHPNPNLRERAMLELAESQDETVIPRLMEALADEDVTYRRAAVKALGAMGTAAIPALVMSLHSSDSVTVRGSCAKALAQVAINYPDEPFPDEGIEGLNAALQDDNPVVHIAAAMALGEVGSRAYETLATALTQTDNLGAQVAMVNAIAATKDPRAVETLTALTQTETTDSYVREAAASALSRLDLALNFRRST